MKKLLVLALVLSMATLANAGLVVSAGPTVEGTTLLSIATDADIVPGVGEGYWALSVAAPSAMAGGVSLFAAQESGIVIFDDAVGAAGIMLPEGTNGVFGGISLATISLVASGTTIYDSISMTGGGLVTLYQVNGDTGELMSTYNAVTVVPEPITMTLLGLGGLFLRRRK